MRKRKFIYWLWGVAEARDFARSFPRPFWRWLLRVTDRYHGYHQNSLGEIILNARSDLGSGCDGGGAP